MLIELGGCDPVLLDDLARIREAMIEAARKGRTTILNTSFHKFSPQGVSGVIVLAESHISVHTWPEESYAAVDVFTCGDRAMPHLVAAHLIRAFSPRKYDIREIARGVPGAVDRSGKVQAAESAAQVGEFEPGMRFASAGGGVA